MRNKKNDYRKKSQPQSWITDEALARSDDTTYSGFASSIQRSSYAIQKSVGGKEGLKLVYNKCWQLSTNNYYQYCNNLKWPHDRTKLAHVTLMIRLLENLLEILVELENTDPYSICSVAIVKAQQVHDMISARITEA